jgi:DNA-binding beta-propeller fold protein YncE
MHRGYEPFLAAAVFSLTLFASAARAAPPVYLRSIAATAAVGVSVGPEGDVYVLNAEQRLVTRFHPDGQFVLSWDPLQGLPASGPKAMGIEVSTGGVVFVSILGGGYISRIRMFDPDGTPLGEILENSLGEPLVEPWGMFADPYDGLLVVDYGASALLRWDGSALTRLAQGVGCGPGQFWGPTGVAAYDGNVYVTEYSDRLTVYSNSGAFVGELGSTAGCGQIRGFPRMVTSDEFGRLVVCDALTDQLMIVSSTGEVLETWGGHGSGPGQFNLPFDVAAGPGGLIYVADRANNRVQVFGDAPTEVATATWGRLKAKYR